MTETRKPKSAKDVSLDPNVKAAIQELERVLATKVKIVERSNKSGRIEIEYYSTEDLDRIYGAITGNTTVTYRSIETSPWNSGSATATRLKAA